MLGHDPLSLVIFLNCDKTEHNDPTVFFKLNKSNNFMFIHFD